MSLTARRYALWTVILGVCWVAGCGVRETSFKESGASLTGTITYQGAPLEFAMVIAQSKDGTKSATGKINSDGKYRVDNVPLGEVMLAVNTMAARGDYESKIRSQNASALDPNASKKITGSKFVDVPQKYFDPKGSGLTATVKEGENIHDIKVE